MITETEKIPLQQGDFSFQHNSTCDPISCFFYSNVCCYVEQLINRFSLAEFTPSGFRHSFCTKLYSKCTSELHPNIHADISTSWWAFDIKTKQYKDRLLFFMEQKYCHGDNKTQLSSQTNLFCVFLSLWPL